MKRKLFKDAKYLTENNQYEKCFDCMRRHFDKEFNDYCLKYNCDEYDDV